MVQPVCPVRASGGPAPLAPQHSRPLSAAPSSPQATARPMQHAGGSVGGPSQQSPGSRVIYTCTYMLCIYVYKGHTAHPIHPCSPPGGQPVRRPGPHRTAAWLHRLPAATTLPSTAQLNTHTHRAGQGTVETAPQCGHNTARSVGRGEEGLLRRGGGRACRGAHAGAWKAQPAGAVRLGRAPSRCCQAGHPAVRPGRAPRGAATHISHAGIRVDKGGALGLAVLLYAPVDATLQVGGWVGGHGGGWAGG